MVDRLNLFEKEKEEEDSLQFDEIMNYDCEWKCMKEHINCCGKVKELNSEKGENYLNGEYRVFVCQSLDGHTIIRRKKIR
jgi:hypothetical protein